MKTNRETIQHLFSQSGLEVLGIVKLTTMTEDYQRFCNWIDQNLHAEMGFLERNTKFRQNPSLLLEGSQSAIIIGMPYYQGDKLNQVLKTKTPIIAQYARMRDYHKEIRKRCEQVVEHLTQTSEHHFRICVDSAPILERALAAKTTKGFIGKNSLFIHPQKGSFYLLAEILTTADLEPDRKEKVDPGQRESDLGGCGTCKRCQINCPTGALNQDYQVDASKCLSYYTIEHRGTIPVKYWPWLKTYLFGCDLCQLACPYNRQSKPAELSGIRDFSTLSLFNILRMSQQEYESWFGGSPVTRAKISGLKRNALIAMVVTKDNNLEEAIRYAQASSHEILIKTLSQIKNYQDYISDKKTIRSR